MTENVIKLDLFLGSWGNQKKLGDSILILNK